MSLANKIRLLKNLDPVAVALGLAGFAVSLYFDNISFDALGSSGLFCWGASQLFGVAGMVASAQARTLKSPREKLGGLTISSGLNAIQFGLLLTAGLADAIGGLLSMSIASVRSAVYRGLCDKETKTYKCTKRTLTLTALGFVSLGWGFLLTGFGVTSPKVRIGDLLQFKAAAVGVCLPMVASVCGTVAGALPRTRNMRPIFTFGGLLNIAYNLLFSGGLSHAISEINACFMNVRQAALQDTPARAFKGRILSPFKRFRFYLRNVFDAERSEEYFRDVKNGYDLLAKAKPEKVVFLRSEEAGKAVLKPIGAAAQALYAKLQNPPQKDPRDGTNMAEAIETVFKDAKSYGFAEPVIRREPETAHRPAQTLYVLRRVRPALVS